MKKLKDIIAEIPITRYIWSSAITFAAAFALYFVSVVDEVTLESFSNGTFVAMLFVATRLGVKAVLELFLTWHASRS